MLTYLVPLLRAHIFTPGSSLAPHADLDGGLIDLAGFLSLGSPSDLSKVRERAAYQEGYLAQRAASLCRWPKLPLLHTGIPPVAAQYALPASLVSEVFGLFTEEVR